MKANPVVFTVLLGLIGIGVLSLVGSFTLIMMGKEVPDGLGVGVVAGVVGALSAILSRTGHDSSAPSGSPDDPATVVVANTKKKPVNVTEAEPGE